MKQFIKCIIAILIAIIIVTLFLINNVNAITSLDPALLNRLSYAEVEVSELVKKDIPSINKNSAQLLKLFEKDLSNVKNTKLIIDEILDRQVIRVSFANYEIDITENGSIVSYKNFEDYRLQDKNRREYKENEPLTKESYCINTKSDLSDIISQIEEYCVLDDYTLVDCSNSIEGVWILTWAKSYGDILNPYENVNVVVDARDGSIMLFGRYENIPNTLIPKLSKEEAVAIAKTSLLEYNYEEIEADIELYKINSLDEVTETRLVWKVSADKNVFIYVDAVDGNILYEDATQSDYARAMCVCAFTGQANRASMASSAFSTLGYNQTGYPAVSWDINQTDIDWVLSRPNLYGLYLGCHGGYYGSYSTLTDNSDWWVYSSTSYGNWHFVFLDACESSVGNNWAYSFGATSTGRAFVGWNINVYQSTAYDFDQRFFPDLGTASVYTVVVNSFWASRNAGYNVVGGNICDPGFAGDANYYGWAW